MHITDLLIESPQNDFVAHREADRAAFAVSHGIYEGKADYKHVEFEGLGDFFCFESPDFGISRRFLICIGLHKPGTIGMSGYVARFTPEVFGFDQGIFIFDMQQIDLASLRRTVNSVSFIETFSHEYIHLIDNARTNRRIVRPDISSKEPVSYLNEPGEFNARYHDIARRWLGLMRHAEDEPNNVRDYVSLYDISGDFQTDLRQLLSTSDSQNRHFLRHLQLKRRQAMLRRLYLLHREMMRRITQAESDNSQ